MLIVKQMGVMIQKMYRFGINYYSYELLQEPWYSYREARTDCLKGKYVKVS